MQITRQNTGTLPTSQNPNQQLLPADLAALVDYMQPTISRFRDAASPLNLMLDTQQIKVGSTSTMRISSTGLGERTIHKISGKIAIKNTAAATQAIKLSPEFPFNLISTVNTQINGNTSISNASPMAYVMEKARRDRNTNIRSMDVRSVRLKAVQDITLNTDPTKASMSGYSSVTVAASKTGILEYEFYFEVPYVLNRDTLIGILPLQNNSTYATITHTAASSLIGEKPTTPMYIEGGVPATTQIDLSITEINAACRYDFWSVPADFNLYQPLILNSFQIIEQPGNTFSTSGPGALKYQFPLNSYLLAAFFTIRNKDGHLVNIKDAVDSVRLEYNGNVTPFKTDIGIHLFNQLTDYGENQFDQFGTILWDGTNTGDQLNFADSAGWVDLYNTSNPTFYADIKSNGLDLPGSYSFVRTQIVPSDVRVAGN